MATQVAYNEAGIWRNADRVSYNEAGTWRPSLITSVNEAGTWREVGRYTVHRGTMTKGTHATGGGTPVITRGWKTALVGSNTTVFGAAYTGLYRRSGDIAVTTYFESAQHNSFANVRVSIDDGVTWATLAYANPIPGTATVGYYITGDPLNFLGIADSAVVNVLVQYV
ncbi:MAG: hypothetical protein H0V63_07070 [Burkholderiaceae bacterium]|nr:hypothetical protein [Burkholderiaceae bacterium]